MSSKLPSILINGHESDQMSVLDRGFQYGDGLFETILVSSGKPQYWREHMDRLLDGCRRLDIPLPEPAVLQSEAESLYRGIDKGVLKITITRGMGGRGYSADASAKNTRVLAIFPATLYPEEYYKEGVVLKVCDTRLGINPSLAGIKHMNRLEQVLARAECDSTDTHEGLMLDINNNVIEGTMSNVFSVKSGVLCTPELSLCGVKGIMREQVIIVAKQAGITVNETQMSLDDLHQSEEIFLSNSLFGIWPVRQLEGHRFNPEPIGRHLAGMLQKSEKEKVRGVEYVA